MPAIRASGRGSRAATMRCPTESATSGAPPRESSGAYTSGSIHDPALLYRADAVHRAVRDLRDRAHGHAARRARPPALALPDLDPARRVRARAGRGWPRRVRPFRRRAAERSVPPGPRGKGQAGPGPDQMSSEGGFTLAPADVPWLDDGPAAKLLAVLDAGGEVRNTLMQLPPGDVDIATTALPEEVLRRARAAGFHPVPTGIEHGTVTVVVAGTPFEVTTLRQDIETDGRHAAVRFGRDWQADAERRDFTMSALFLTRERRVIDFVGGVADIEARRVRFIGDPDTRIREDYLRILRFFRFFAAHGEGVPEGASLAACIRNRGGLAQLSRERVRVETMKLLPGKRAAEAATAMAESGILDRVLAGVADLPALTRMAAIETAMQLEPDAVRRLAALAVRVVEDAERLRERLRLSNDEYRRLVAVGDGWWRVLPSADDAAARTLLYRLGAD